MVRLRRVRISSPGWTRRHAGSDFAYLDLDRAPITDDEHLTRITALAIPPAWSDVWICPWPNGHIQAAGLDDAQRRQYVYHAQWQARRARLKHDHVLTTARRLPAARRTVRRDLAAPGFPRSKALALAFRLLDLAYFRAGGEGYARRNGSYGLATLRREHVDLVTGWHDISSAEVGADVKRRLGELASPKGFRTWHATVLAARGLAEAGPAPASERGRPRVIGQMVRDVAGELGNTPAVCRASYIDPRVIDLWEHGTAITPTRSQAVGERRTLAMLS